MSELEQRISEQKLNDGSRWQKLCCESELVHNKSKQELNGLDRFKTTNKRARTKLSVGIKIKQELKCLLQLETRICEQELSCVSE